MPAPVQGFYLDGRPLPTSRRGGRLGLLRHSAAVVFAVALLALIAVALSFDLAMRAPLVANPGTPVGSSPDASTSPPASASVSPLATDEPTTSLPSPSVAVTPAAEPTASGMDDRLSEALNSTPVTVLDQEGRWLVGTLGSGLRPLDASNDDWVIPAGPFLVHIARGADNMAVAIVDPSDATTRPIGTFPISMWVGAVADASGDRVYVHGSSATEDHGVRVYDVGTRTFSVLLDPSPITEELTGRKRLALSPSGNTLASTFCGPVECHVDVIDTSSGTVRRLAEPLGGVAVTDGAVLGNRDGSWLLYDLTGDTVQQLPHDQIEQVDAVYAIDDSHFIIDSLSIGRYAIFELSAETGELRTLSEHDDGFDGGTFYLIDQPLAADRWLLTGSSPSLNTIYLSDVRHGQEAVLQVVDRETGSVVTQVRPFAP